MLVNLAFDDWAISPAHYRRGLKWRRKQLGSSQTLSIKLKMKRLNKLLSWQAKSSKIINIKVLNIHTVKRGDLERKEKKKRKGEIKLGIGINVFGRKTSKVTATEGTIVYTEQAEQNQTETREGMKLLNEKG